MGWSPPCISGIEKHSAGALPTWLGLGLGLGLG